MQTLAVIKSITQMSKQTTSGKNKGQSLYAISLSQGFSTFMLYRTQSQLAQDLKSISEIEYIFLSGTTLSLPAGKIVEAGSPIVNKSTGEVLVAKTRQYRVSEDLPLTEAFATVESLGDNFIDFRASRMERKERLANVTATVTVTETAPALTGLEDLA